MTTQEDVLDGHIPDPPPPRTSFHRARDIVVALVIAVASVAVAVVVWHRSDLRATTSTTGPDNVPPVEQPTVFPPSLGEAWQARSGATPSPVVAGPSVVTGDGDRVLGRDPLTGDVRWTYRRDLSLCTVSTQWGYAIAVYRKDSTVLPDGDPRLAGGCSEVTMLDATTGKRGPQRVSDAELGTRLLTTDPTYVTPTGSRYLTTWRSDLVLTQQYGQVPVLVNPDKQPRTGCTYSSVAAGLGQLAVIERGCASAPGEAADTADRLSVFRASPKESDKPDMSFSLVLPTTGARVLAVSDKLVAVAQPDPSRVTVYDLKGDEVGEYPVQVPEQGFAGDPAGRIVSTAQSGAAVFWFTGTDTIALSVTDFHPLWTVQGTMGAGTLFAGRLLVPVPDGLAVCDANTGQRVGTIAVNRAGYTGEVTMSSLGTMVFEQRGDTLVALH